MISIGEKVETIIYARASGAFGLYLGSSAETLGAARVDGMTFKVAANFEFGDIGVFHLESGLTEAAEDRYLIGVAIDRLVSKVKAQRPDSIPHRSDD